MQTEYVGGAGAGYVCGCYENYVTGEKTYCKNPTHILHKCGCYNIGGNVVRCTKHIIFLLIATVLIGLGLAGLFI